ncbi:hypothetical protein GOBAR_DD23087 [Gossypium barbadense]|nr:hypothetical protein GOBAR_DD23087 [Gossypium barbadense]
MELVDDEDVETMIALYCRNKSDKNAPIHLFAELAGVEQNEDVNAYGEEHGAQEPCMVAPISGDHYDQEVDSDSDPDMDDVPDDIDDEDVNNDGNINASSVGNQMRRILIHNNPGPHMLLINPNAVHVAEFLEYPEIVFAHRLAVNSDNEELFVGQRFKMYELEPHIFHQRMIRLESDVEGQTNTYFRQWLGTMEPWQWAQSFDEGFRYGQMTTNLVEGVNDVLLKTRHLPIASVFSATFYRLATLMPRMSQQQVDQMEAGHMFVKDVRDVMVANHRMARSMNVEIYSRRLKTFRVTETIGRRPGIPPRSYRVDLRNRQCDCRRFETLHYLCAHVMATCAKVNLNVEQFVDDMYTLKRTKNEFPVLPDLSTWEVPPTIFEIVPDRGVCRNPRGHPQASRIHNEMDIMEKSDGKRCGLCRLIGHNRNKCPQENYHVGQSSRSGRN